MLDILAAPDAARYAGQERREEAAETRAPEPGSACRCGRGCCCYRGEACGACYGSWLAGEGVECLDRVHSRWMGLFVVGEGGEGFVVLVFGLGVLMNGFLRGEGMLIRGWRDRCYC